MSGEADTLGLQERRKVSCGEFGIILLIDLDNYFFFARKCVQSKLVLLPSVVLNF